MKKNIEKFRKYFDVFIVLITLFLFYIYLLAIAWNTGMRFDMGRAVVPAMGILFYYIGVLLKHAKRNWFIGIRTPWTLSSDKVWEKTHEIAGKFFKIAGVIAVLGIFFPQWVFLIVVAPILLFVIYIFIYSYFLYQKEK